MCCRLKRLLSSCFRGRINGHQTSSLQEQEVIGRRAAFKSLITWVNMDVLVEDPVNAFVLLEKAEENVPLERTLVSLGRSPALDDCTAIAGRADEDVLEVRRLGEC